MQNKGVIRLFAIVFALACIYQLSFTWKARGVENDAREFAQGDKDKERGYLDSVAGLPVYDLLIEEFTYKEVKAREINLGLDLRGGMNVILEVSVKDILRELADNSQAPIFLEALENTDKAQADSQDDYLTTFFAELDKLNQASGSPMPLSAPVLFGSKEMNDALGFNPADEEVKNEIRSQVDASVENVYTVLRARIDQFGVVQPNIQRLENSGRILVELPGVQDPERVKKLLQSTAELEFWNLHEGTELLGFLNDANERLRELFPRETKAAAGDTSKPQSDLLQEITAVDGDQDSATGEEGTEADTAATSEADSLQNDSYNPLFEILYPNYDFTNNRPGEGPIVGQVAVKDTGKVNRFLRLPQIRQLLPAEMRYARFLWTAKPVEGTEILYLLAARGNRDGTPALSGEVVADAAQDFDERNQPVVRMQMNAVGAAAWQKITREAAMAEPKRSVAVVLDNYVYSFPRVNDEISGGNTQIYGNFTIEEAQDLANILKAGKLPAPARIIQADVVGPSLGKEAISAGLWSFVVAMFVVLLYMIFYYSGAGVVSNIALLVNMLFIFGVLAGLGAVLTLPGIAGIVLTIGMAVDANVLIYERVREEVGHGKGLRLAIADGYKNAYSSIIDANVTTLLTGVILYVFGTGPIRGFATTLIIGILTSLFSAIFITRLVFEDRLSRKKGINFSTKLTANAFKNINIDWIGKRKVAYTISGIIIAIGLTSLFTRGLNFGVDFVGGRSYQVRFDQPVSTVDIQKALGEVYVLEDGTKVAPEVKTIGSSSQVIITTKYKVNETGLEVEDEIRSKLFAGVQPFYAQPITEDDFFNDQTERGLKSERQVGPTIADDIQTSAIWSMLAAFAIIFLYILVRFNRWQFSLGALVAVVHDVLIVLSLFSLLHGIVPFTLEIDQAFIAALLTVVGYSLNDTVVVFDRIREYFNTHKVNPKSIKILVNDALNQTLSRTLNTSLTTIFVLLVIFIWGGDVIRGFMFALLVGIVVGTYSSLFIATPVMLDTTKPEEEKPAK